MDISFGRSLDAYQESANPEYAFGYLAQRLAETESADPLLAGMATAHVSRVPGSPDGYFYRGRA